MEHNELSELFEKLLRDGESELVEFKEAKNDYKTDELGEYFSALSNEANLHGAESAWLVFGVNDKTRSVVGTNYRKDSERLQSVKMQIAQGTSPSISLRNIHVFSHPNGRILMFEIPRAPRGIPIAWKGHYYARAGESLVSLGLGKLDTIRQQTLDLDWSAQVVEGATLNDLDEAAIAKARESFAKKHANRIDFAEVEGWTLETFLDRARLTHNGKLTRATLLLVGKAESAYRLFPNPAQITWKLEGQESAYEHFAPPFLLNTTKLYQKIRNIQLRILPHDNLVPIEVSKYDQKIVLEALHNCIAHQNYALCGRVIVTERPDKLIFENSGSFFEGVPDEYVEGKKTPRSYRNACLAQTMMELNMIDTMGYGLHQIYNGQARRYLPMPDYDLSTENLVKMTLYGAEIDSKYSRLLIQYTDLALGEIIALDRIQKKLPIPDPAGTRLKRLGLIEGRKPNYHLSAAIAKISSADQAASIRSKSQDDEYYAKLVCDYLKKFRKASRSEIDHLLINQGSEAFNPEQKTNKISNLLTSLRRAGKIKNIGSRKIPCWVLAE